MMAMFPRRHDSSGDVSHGADSLQQYAIYIVAMKIIRSASGLPAGSRRRFRGYRMAR
jgi:hypothetical protein